MKNNGLLPLILFLALAACSRPTPAPQVTSTTVPTPTATALPLARQVKLAQSTIQDEGKKPDYVLKADVPVLQGSSDPRVQTFNIATITLVQKEIDGFKTNVSQLPAEPISGGSSFDMTFETVSPPGNLLSLLFTAYIYSDGAAHPYSYSVTYTYDLEKGAPVSLEQLFLPDSGYLNVIATWCRAELSKRDIGFLDYGTQGADPLADNYRNWNVTPDGLRITFDPYQVAPYVFGSQTVTVPYDALQDVIDPDGPLGGYQ
jgi:hypothetical protein